MSQIKISTQEVSDTANKIRTCSSSMYDSLQAMKKEMDSLEGTWLSDGSQEIRSRFQLFAARFAKHKEEMDRYASFLDMTVSSYDTLESTIRNNAADMQY